MHRVTLVAATLFAALAVVPTRAAAQDSTLPYGIIVAEQARASFTLLGAGARAAGMGGAFTAVADDATAASFNPAGLAQLLVPEISIVGSHTRLEDSYGDFVSFGDDIPPLLLGDGTIEHDKSSLNFVSLTLPFRLADRRWAFQVSQHRRVDFGYEGTLDVPAHTPSGEHVLHVMQHASQSGDITTLSASLAIELTRRTLLGIAVNRWSGDWGFSSVNQSSLVDDPTTVQRFTYTQSNEIEGTNFDLGLLLRYPKLNIGIRYSTAFDADYTFRTAVLEPEPLRGGEGLDTTLHWPHRLNVGIAFKPFDRWILAVDWGRTDWSGLTFDVPSDTGYSIPLNFFDLRPPGSTNTDVADDWRVGTEILFFAGRTVIPLRLGYFLEPQPSRDIFTDERVEWQGVSLGVGVKVGGFAFDLAAHYKTSKTEVSRFFLNEDLRGDDLFPNSFGTLDRNELSVFASVILQFGKGTGLGRAWDAVFVGSGEGSGGD